LLKGLFLILLLAATFSAGFYLGTSSNKEIKERYTNLKDEMTMKTRGLESEVSSVRARLNLVEARDFLGLARTDIRNKNFGDAEFKIKKAEERVDKAISLSSETQKKKLIPYQTKIASLRKDLQRLGPQVGTQIEAIEKELEKITG
jgi:hypothetical protein